MAILDFTKISFFLREAQTINRTVFVTFLERRIRKAAEKTDCNVFCEGSILQTRCLLSRRYCSPLKYELAMTSAVKLLESVETNLRPGSKIDQVSLFSKTSPRYQFGKPSVTILQYHKPIFSKAIKRRDLRLGTRIPELLRYSLIQLKLRPELRYRPISTGSALV